MASADQISLCGVWRLLRCEQRYSDGRLELPYGERPIGLVVYEPGGYMSAQIMHSNDGLTADASLSQVARTALRSYMAYYGRYELDPATATVTHHVEAALNPTWVGGDQVRYVSLEDETLVFRPPAEADGSQMTLYWRRVSFQENS